jgi:hypothetical protein
MNHSLSFLRAIALWALASFAAVSALAQSPTKPAANGWVAVNGPFRKLAPGVMQEVESGRRAEDTVQRHDVTELLFVDPKADFAKDVSFPQQVWTLDVKYKPVRMIWADIPATDGRMLRKQVWYIVYQVTNPGKAYKPVQKEDELNKLDVSGKLYTLETESKAVRFTPVFTLETHNLLVNEKPGFSKAAVEQYLPIVLPAIRDREDRNREFLASQEMAQREIQVGETVWGVATWTDVDPNCVWLSVYVEGLTNAYRWSDDPAKYAASKNGTSKAPFREISTKVLRLNFWRPGDEFNVEESQIRTGVPELPGGPKLRPAFEWVWWRTYPASDKAVPAGQ